MDAQEGDAEDDALTAVDVAQLLSRMPPELLQAVLQRAAELRAKESAAWGRALRAKHDQGSHEPTEDGDQSRGRLHTQGKQRLGL